MARVALPIQEIPRNGSINNISFTAADATNNHEVDNVSGAVLIIAKNDDAAQKVVTIQSVDDPYGREGDDTITVPANGLGIGGPYLPSIFNGATTVGKLDVDVDADTSLSLAAVRFAR